MTERDVDAILAARPILTPSAQRLREIKTAVLRDLKPVRPLASDGTRFAMFAAAFVAVWAIGCYLVGQLGWYGLSEEQRAGIFFPLIAIIALTLFSMVQQTRPGAWRARLGILWASGLFVLLVLAMALLFRPVEEPAFVRSGLACFKMGMAFAIPASVLLGLLVSRGAVLWPSLTGATVGGASGLVGLAALEIHCPDLNVYHIVAWHVSVTLVSAVAGFVFSSVTSQRSKSNY